MPEYYVQYEIIVNADDPLAAAKEVKEIFQDPEAIPPVLDVRLFDPRSLAFPPRWTVDLADPEPEAKPVNEPQSIPLHQQRIGFVEANNEMAERGHTLLYFGDMFVAWLRQRDGWYLQVHYNPDNYPVLRTTLLRLTEDDLRDVIVTNHSGWRVLSLAVPGVKVSKWGHEHTWRVIDEPDDA